MFNSVDILSKQSGTSTGRIVYSVQKGHFSRAVSNCVPNLVFLSEGQVSVRKMLEQYPMNIELYQLIKN